MSRDPARIERICELLCDAWKRYPDERLGQFLLNAAGHAAIVWEREDDEWEDDIWGRIVSDEIRQHRVEKAALATPDAEEVA